MSKTFDQGKEEVAKLCRYFATNRQAFLAPGVNEAHIRQSLIDPLFESLGWDVCNTAMTAPQYREVIPEDSLDVEGQHKAPDYTFRVGTLRKFYAEAKKCGVNIGADPGPAYQLRRYGWSGKVALSVLTDFEEFGVYDCTMRPRPSDKASHARIQYLRFEEYPDRWRELWDVFSREAVWSGAFDRYAASKRKRGTSEVDVEFLKEIEGWRDALARDIALRNKDLSSDDVNAAVQLTIDRVVFLRMAEDRGLEPYGQLLKLCERPDVYPRFMRDLCHRADQKYNSGLFHFQKESGVSEDPDRITPKLTVDDKVFKPILQNLYFEHGSPYHFGVLPVEILGTVYERFLGKVIRLTAGHQAKVEEKPEVRKAGGVYYTPAYIVEYIVKHTVGRQIEGRSPAQLAGEKGKPPFRVLDMACGSGSFLLGAYQCLLDYCLKWYIEHKPETFKKAVYRDPRNGQWRLTIEEKKRILTTHIFGVDIDLQAVEVSKLSLLLKVLEGETDQSFSLSQLPFGDRALPNLADNVKCGNSLIGPDYFTGKLIADPEEMTRVNAFDWKQEFPTAVREREFDCIIGNPPYVRIQTTHANDLNYYQARYESAVGNYDIYCLFVERGLTCLRPNGLLGFILSHRFFKTDYGQGLRQVIARRAGLQEIVDFDGYMVFENASINTCILILSTERSREVRFAKAKFTHISDKELGPALSEVVDRSTPHFEIGVIDVGHLSDAPWIFVRQLEEPLWGKLESIRTRLRDVATDIFQGLKTGADGIYTAEIINDNGRLWRVRFLDEAEARPIEASLMRRLIKGGEMKRFAIAPTRRAILFPYNEGQLIPPRIMAAQYANAWEYLVSKKSVLHERESGKMRGQGWYAYTRNQALTAMMRPKIVVPDYYAHASFGLDSSGEYFFCGGGAGGYGIVLRSGIDPIYVVGLLNSKLLDWYLHKVTVRAYQTAYMYVKKYIEQLPVIMPSNHAHHNQIQSSIVGLVDTIVQLVSRSFVTTTLHERTSVQRQIDATDAEIDRLVYDLYGLTAGEIAIVEGKDQ
jgi:hypothetical protein